MERAGARCHRFPFWGLASSEPWARAKVQAADLGRRALGDREAAQLLASCGAGMPVRGVGRKLSLTLDLFSQILKLHRAGYRATKQKVCKVKLRCCHLNGLAGREGPQWVPQALRWDPTRLFEVKLL